MVSVSVPMKLVLLIVIEQESWSLLNKGRGTGILVAWGKFRLPLALGQDLQIFRFSIMKWSMASYISYLNNLL
jgi:hypothetical protein